MSPVPGASKPLGDSRSDFLDDGTRRDRTCDLGITEKHLQPVLDAELERRVHEGLV
jgi:hypothetical protein